MRSAALTVSECPSAIARIIAEREHYMHRKPQVQWAWALLEEPSTEIVGVVTFGTPASRHVQLGACPSRPSLVVELNRLWVSDALPRNTESWFVSRALRRMPPRIVVSYADTAAGHVGYVYRAMSWRYAGWTDMDRKTPRFDYVPAQPGAHTRDAFRNGWTHRVRRKPKVRYWTTTGRPAERRALAELCGWPSLDWHELPPPLPERCNPWTCPAPDACCTPQGCLCGA